jgi:hypothetical protein
MEDARSIKQAPTRCINLPNQSSKNQSPFTYKPALTSDAKKSISQLSKHIIVKDRKSVINPYIQNLTKRSLASNDKRLSEDVSEMIPDEFNNNLDEEQKFTRLNDTGGLLWTDSKKISSAALSTERAPRNSDGPMAIKKTIHQLTGKVRQPKTNIFEVEEQCDEPSQSSLHEEIKKQLQKDAKSKYVSIANSHKRILTKKDTYKIGQKIKLLSQAPHGEDIQHSVNSPTSRLLADKHNYTMTSNLYSGRSMNK